VVIDLIMAACLGRAWAMRFATMRPLSVAYCAGEGVGGLSARFAAAAEFWGVQHLPNFHFFRDIPQLYHKAGNATPANHIFRFVSDWQHRQDGPLDLLVLDTLHAATVGSEENSASDTGVVLQAARYASSQLGCAVLLVHHTNKTGTTERGSSALRGAMDTMIGVKKLSEDATSTKAAICCEKLKDGDAWKTQTFDLVAMADSVRVWWDEPAEPGQRRGATEEHKRRILALLRELPGQRLRATAISDALGMNRGNVSNYLSQLEIEKAVVRYVENLEKPQSAHNPWVYSVPTATATDEKESV